MTLRLVPTTCEACSDSLNPLNVSWREDYGAHLCDPHAGVWSYGAVVLPRRPQRISPLSWLYAGTLFLCLIFVVLWERVKAQ